MLFRKISAALAIALILAGCTTTASKADADSAEVPQKKTAKVEKPAPAAASEQAGKEISFKIAFVNHLDANLPEQDAYIEREKGSGKVYRATKGDNDMSAPLYRMKHAVEHDPFNPDALGPYERGEPLGITLGEWLKARGTGTYTYKDGVGTLDLEFTGLVPNGVYTMWHVFVVLPPTTPFSGTLDAPLGARDGSTSVFVADANGNAKFNHTFRPGLQLSDVWTTSMLAIAYHSDGKTYGGVPGEIGHNVHVPLFVMLPKREGLE